MTSATGDAELILTVITGIAWTFVYLNAVWIGIRQKTYAMPVVALALNFAWELTYAVYDTNTAILNPTMDNTSWALVEIAWAIADIAIVYTFLKFGRVDFPFLTKSVFITWFIGMFGICLAWQLLFVVEFGARTAVTYSAFLQTLLMSGLFIGMFYARRGPRGQSLTIAVGKLVGTLAATILYGVIEFSSFILGLGVMCFILDLLYVGLIARAKILHDARASTAIPTAERVSA